MNWDVTKIEVYDNKSNDKLFEFFSNDTRFSHSWLQIKNTEYLICAEDLFGGQTVIDLTNREMSSYSPDEDGFIWTDFHLSPDGKNLATIGCFWACPYVIKIYDFNSSLELPLTELKEIDLLGGDETIIGWLDNKSLKSKGTETEQVREYVENGGFRFKTVKETKFERIVKIRN